MTPQHLLKLLNFSRELAEFLFAGLALVLERVDFLFKRVDAHLTALSTFGRSAPIALAASGSPTRLVGRDVFRLEVATTGG